MARPRLTDDILCDFDRAVSKALAEIKEEYRRGGLSTGVAALQAAQVLRGVAADIENAYSDGVPNEGDREEPLGCLICPAEDAGDYPACESCPTNPHADKAREE